MKRAGLAWLGAALVTFTSPLLADEIAMLPVGDPARAYILASGAAGDVIDCRDLAAKGPASFDAMITDLATADFVLIGEHHTNLPGHEFEARVVKALIDSGRPVILGMEFFETHDDPALARYIAGETDLRTMLAQSDWYGPSGGNYNFAYYQPMVEAMKDKKFAVRGINVPRDWVRTVSRGGRDKLTDEQKQFLPDTGPTDERHRHVINRMMGGFGASMPEMFDGMYRGQTTWDAAMAASLLRIHAEPSSGPKPVIVTIVGVGHIGHGLGIPARLKASNPSFNIRIVSPVVADKPDEDAQVHPGFVPKETATFSRGYGDFVYILPDTGGEKAYPDLGMRLSVPAASASGSSEGVLEVSGAAPASIAGRAGIRKGDRIASIDGVNVTTVADAAFVLSSLKWDQVVRLGVYRANETDGKESIVLVPVALVPATDGNEDWLSSRIGFGILENFDPSSDRAYTATGKEKPASLHARLVTRQNKPVRIDVMNGTVLMQAWKLDEKGRPILGLFNTPAPDGAVRVEIVRDETGKVTSQTRRNAKGDELKV